MVIPMEQTPTDHDTTVNSTVHFAFSATDADGDLLTYYLYINGTYNASTTSPSLEVFGFNPASYEYVLFAWDGYTNGTNSTIRYFNIQSGTPLFSTHERTPLTPNEDEEVQLNISVANGGDINSVWLAWNGTINYTYLTKGVRNESTEFWINMTVGNMTAHDIVYYEWWANTSVGINSTGNYSFTVANQAPGQPSFTAPSANNKSANHSVYFAWGAVTDNDAEDTVTYYLYINGTYNTSTTSTSVVVDEFDAGNYEYILFAFDQYDNGTNSTTGYFNIDTPPGQVSVTAPTDHQSSNNKTVHFTFSASDADGDPLTFYLYINGTYNASTTSTTSLEATGFDYGNYEYVFFAWDGYTNGTNSTIRYFNIVATDYPQFSSHERVPDTPNEDEEVRLNITVTDASQDINTVWMQWNGTTNYTYLTHKHVCW
jgi:hypothetical protein